MNQMRLFATLLLLAQQQFQLADGFSTPFAPVGCGSRTINFAPSSFKVRQLDLQQCGCHQSQIHSSSGLRMVDGGGAAAAVPKRGFIEKVNLFSLSLFYVVMCNPSSHFNDNQIIHYNRSNPKSHQPPNAKNFFHSGPCSSSSSSTTPSYAIPKMYSWSLPKNPEPKSYPSSRLMSTCPPQLVSLRYTANCAIRWSNEMSSTLALSLFSSSSWHSPLLYIPMSAYCIHMHLWIR